MVLLGYSCTNEKDAEEEAALRRY